MDEPGLDESLHGAALAGLQRINRASHAARIIAQPLAEMARDCGLKNLTLLDVACGGGDVPVAVAKLLQAQGLHVELSLMDRSPTALELAAKAAKQAGVRARTTQGSAPDGLPPGQFDAITCSLFMHHLQRPEVIETLAHMRQRAQRMIVISDLRRSAMGWALAWAGCRVLSRSAIVHHDGTASVRAAWTKTELAEMAREAGMHATTDESELRVTACWPWRMLLVWQRRGPVEGEGRRD